MTDHADKEAERLQSQSTRIEKRLLNEDFIRPLTSIDGALLIDPEGCGHAIGVILDGSAEPLIGDPARGARYNSACRYINQALKAAQCLAIIVSEDGMVNIVDEQALELQKVQL